MTRPQFIRFGREICGELAQAERREWWLANGRGAYAAGTVTGTLTRRYHGLLIAPLAPPLGRSLVFAKADAWLEADDQRWPLFSNRWANDIIDPSGHTHIEAFWLDGRMPAWRFAFGDLKLDLRMEEERGLPSHDHHLCVGEYVLPLTNGEWSGLTTSLEENASPYIEEINALWYNALKVMAVFASMLQLSANYYEQQAAATHTGFQRFFNPANGGLFDVLDGPDGNDDSLRPNQILAVSLPYSPLANDIQQAVVKICGNTLLTSYGLRSLAGNHPGYTPHYGGGVRERDGAYHQGTVWAWLLGHYALAEYRISHDVQKSMSRLKPIRDHLLDAGLGTVSEIFDADPPHTPRGAPAQAWSVACVLEAWWRLEKERRKS